MSLSSTSIQRPVTIVMFFVGVVVLGIIAFRSLAVDFLPPIRIPKLTIQTVYANVSPEEVENAVTQRIESQLGSVTGVKKTSSISREGVSIVMVEFYWNTNMDFAMLEVREKLDQLRATLPQEAGRPTILKVDPSTEPVMTIAVSEKQRVNRGPVAFRAQSVDPVQVDSQYIGTRADLIKLVELKETSRALIKRRIEQVEGVAQAAVLGGLEREIQVDVDLIKLESLGISLDKVASALSAANLNLPGGTIKSGLFRYSLRTVGEFQRVDEIRDVVIANIGTNRIVRVTDIGSVYDSFKERAGLTRYNGSEIIAIQVRKEAGTNTVEVSQRVLTVLRQLEQENPNLQLNVVSDQAEFISRSISDVEQAIIIGATLAFLVLFFFLRGFRSPVIIGLCMPISILATFIAMYFLRVNLNIISLTGLALGIGMLGDNAIMVVENVTRLREKGMSLLEASLEGSKEINLAVTASTLTNVAIFLPIIFVEGVASQLFLDMGVTMTVSLMVSLLVAVTLVPMLVSREVGLAKREFSAMGYLESKIVVKRKFAGRMWFWSVFPFRSAVALLVSGYLRSISFAEMQLSKVSPAFYWAVESTSESTNRALSRYLDWALEKRSVVVIGTIAIFVASVVVSYFIPSAPAPDIDQSRFTIQILMPKGTTLEGTSSFAHQLEQTILKLPDIKGVYASVGMTDEQNYWTVSSAAIERADLEVKVTDQSQTDQVIQLVRELVGRLQTSASGVNFAVKKRGTTFEQILKPSEQDIRIRVLGKDPATAFQVADGFSKRISAVEGLVDLQAGMQKGSPEYRIVVDKDRAARYRLSVQSIAREIEQRVKGREATTLSDFDRKITIRVEPTAEQRQTFENLLASSIVVEGSTVPVRELIQWEKTTGYSEIWRENQQRAVIVTANVSNRPVGAVVGDIQKAATKYEVPGGYRIVVGGENEEIADSFRSLLIIIVLSIFLVYMILAAEYESILYPFVIILTSPLAFIGAIGAMVLAGQSYNVMSLIGIVIMIGAVDNDAVIAVDIITLLRRDGMGLAEAVKEGMQKRLRPILMTTVTTVLGVVPLVFEFGTGSELVRALTIPLVGGLIASTFFTIVAIPIVYTYIDKWAIGRKSGHRIKVKVD